VSIDSACLAVKKKLWFKKIIIMNLFFMTAESEQTDRQALLLSSLGGGWVSFIALREYLAEHLGVQASSTVKLSETTILIKKLWFEPKLIGFHWNQRAPAEELLGVVCWNPLRRNWTCYCSCFSCHCWTSNTAVILLNCSFSRYRALLWSFSHSLFSWETWKYDFQRSEAFRL